jgi:DNA-binding LacI/PurR family transcriptional regulator
VARRNLKNGRHGGSVEFVTEEPLPIRDTRLGREIHACKSVAVIIGEPAANLFDDTFFRPLVSGISAALAQRSMLMVLLALHSAQEMELAEAYLAGGQVDGAILVSLHGDNPLPARLRELGLSAVICGRPPKDLAVSYIDCDNRRGASLAVNHLIHLGRRHIATIAGNLDMPGAVDRLMGYRDALIGAGVALDPTLEEVGDYRAERAVVAMERLLDNHPDVDAVFVASDLMAVAAIKVLAKANRRIPEDVAVVGFDDSAAAKLSSPALSSVRQPIETMGHEAVDILVHHMSKPSAEPQHIVFGPELVIRESTMGRTRPRRA